jgi:hypothetical protein
VLVPERFSSSSKAKSCFFPADLKLMVRDNGWISGVDIFGSLSDIKDVKVEDMVVKTKVREDEQIQVPSPGTQPSIFIYPSSLKRSRWRS